MSRFMVVDYKIPQTDAEPKTQWEFWGRFACHFEIID